METIPKAKGAKKQRTTTGAVSAQAAQALARAELEAMDAAENANPPIHGEAIMPTRPGTADDSVNLGTGPGESSTVTDFSETGYSSTSSSSESSARLFIGPIRPIVA